MGQAQSPELGTHLHKGTSGHLQSKVGFFMAYQCIKPFLSCWDWVGKMRKELSKGACFAFSLFLLP